MVYLKKFYDRMREMIPMVMFMIVYLLAFSLLEKRRPADYTEIHIWLDDAIPFTKVFIIPYLLWFAFVAVSVICLYLTDRKNYDRTATLLYFGMTVFLVISFVFPNVQYLRPRYIPGQDLFSVLVRRLYRTDTNTNVFPSIHVYNTLCCMAGMLQSRAKIAQKVWIRAGVVILGVSIILSTMFLKQHSLIDVIGACLLFVPMHVLVFGYDMVIATRRSGAFSHR